MNNKKKTLKSPLSAIFDSCDELKAKAAGEAQRSIATEILLHLDGLIMKSRDLQEGQIAVEIKLMELKKSLSDFLKKPE